jgi:8-oxo-dGTP pyrophosphatase MutT (NUDIX family)
MAKKKVRQGGGVIVYGDQVVLRRTKSGKWIFPKGHIEHGETEAQTAIREAEEETGLLVELVEPAGAIEFKDDDERVEVEYYILRALGPGPGWDAHRDVDSFLVPPGQVRVLLSFGKLRRLWSEIEERVRSQMSGVRP